MKRKVSGVGTRIVEGPKKNLYVVEVKRRKKKVDKKKRELREVTDKQGKKVKRWISKKSFSRDEVVRPKEEYYRGYAAKRNYPVAKGREIVPYDADFAKRQEKRMPRELTQEERKRAEAEALLDSIDIGIKVPSRWKRKVQKEVGRAFETKAYKKAKGAGAKTVSAVREWKEEQAEAKKEETVKAKKGGAGIKVGKVDLNMGDVFQILILIIALVLILGFLSWISNLF